jgi:hypothetical protein
MVKGGEYYRLFGGPQLPGYRHPADHPGGPAAHQKGGPGEGSGEHGAHLQLHLGALLQAKHYHRLKLLQSEHEEPELTYARRDKLSELTRLKGLSSEN